MKSIKEKVEIFGLHFTLTPTARCYFQHTLLTYHNGRKKGRLNLNIIFFFKKFKLSLSLWTFGLGGNRISHVAGEMFLHSRSPFKL